MLTWNQRLRARIPTGRGASAAGWARFERQVRAANRPLLAALPQYRDAILVGGCQRSGTRLVAHLLAASGRLSDARDAADPELAGAWRLAGYGAQPLARRACFQTTYLDDRFREYLEHPANFLVWVIREPGAVVRSMLYNWYRPGRERLFRHCGRHAARRIGASWWWRLSTLDRACLSYNAKIDQLTTLHAEMPPSRLSVVDYDALRACPQAILAKLAERLQIDYRPEVTTCIRRGGTGVAGDQLSLSQLARVEQYCGRRYAIAKQRVQA